MAKAVTGPTPGCVVSNRACGRWRTSSSTRRFSSSQVRVQSVQRLQQLLAPLGRVRQQRQLLQLDPSRPTPQLPLLLHAVTQRHGLQLVLGPRPPLHLLCRCTSNCRTSRSSRLCTQILESALPAATAASAVRPDGPSSAAAPPNPHLPRVPEPQLPAQLGQQPLEPGIVSARLHPHPHRTAQLTIKPLRFLPVL